MICSPILSQHDTVYPHASHVFRRLNWVKSIHNHKFRFLVEEKQSCHYMQPSKRHLFFFFDSLES